MYSSEACASFPCCSCAYAERYLLLRTANLVIPPSPDVCLPDPATRCHASVPCTLNTSLCSPCERWTCCSATVAWKASSRLPGSCAIACGSFEAASRELKNATPSLLALDLSPVANCASIVAASMRPNNTQLRSGDMCARAVHCLRGACFSTLRTSSGTSDQPPVRRAVLSRSMYRVAFSLSGAWHRQSMTWVEISPAGSHSSRFGRKREAYGRMRD